jgi:hypothetical protein
VAQAALQEVAELAVAHPGGADAGQAARVSKRWLRSHFS